MATYKLLMEDDEKETFSLLAIHCSEEAYILAYLLNKHLGFQLKRERQDLNYQHNELNASFPLFQFENNLQYTTYSLIANKCKSILKPVVETEGLFKDDSSEKTITTYLMPEFTKVDFFLKINSEFETILLRNLISKINEIKQIISAYEVAIATIKSKNNLIFD